MSVHTPEVAGAFGALDSDVAAANLAASADWMRELSRSQNQLVSEGDVIISLPFTADELTPDEELRGGYILTAPADGWRRAYWGPLIGPKKSTHNRGELRVIAKITLDAVVWLRVSTTGRPLRPSDLPSDANTLEMVGTGDFEVYELDDVVLGDGDTETVELFVMSAPLTEGSPTTTSTGTVDRVRTSWFEDDSAGFEHTANDAFLTGAYSVQFAGPDGRILVQNRRIAGIHDDYVSPSNETNALSIAPDFSVEEKALVEGSTYTILGAASVRLASITLAEQDLV